MDKDDFKEMFEGMKVGVVDITPKEPTVPEHYGMSIEKHEEIMKEILIDLIKYDSKTDVIDKHFPKLDSDDRAKVLAFAFAAKLREKVEL